MMTEFPEIWNDTFQDTMGFGLYPFKIPPGDHHSLHISGERCVSKTVYYFEGPRNLQIV